MRIAIVGAALTIGFAWGADYGLAGRSMAAVLAAHAVAGGALALALVPLAKRGCPRAPRAGVLLATFFVLAVLPVLHESFGPGALDPLQRVALGLGSAGLAVAIALGVARAGAVAAAIAGIASCAAAFALSEPSAARLSAHPTVAVAPAAWGLKRVAVIGIDGGDWRVIDPLIAAGELPNLAALRARGVHGVLHSIEPTYSPVVWASIFSGKGPEKHGITGWLDSHAANRKAAMLWEIAAGAGLRSIVANVPGTWPPQEVDGALVSGFPMPAAVVVGRGPSGQAVGTVVQAGDRHGTVPTARATPAASRDGALEASMRLGLAPAHARTRARHWLIERLVRLGDLASVEARVRIRIEPASPDGMQRMQVEDESFDLAPRAWSPWIETRVGGAPAWFRARRLETGGLYLTPLFQDPKHPIHAFTSSEEVDRWVAEGGMYVVEGAGWRSADDADVRDAAYEHLVDVSQRQFDGVVRLLDEVSDWSLLGFVFTLTDRTSHAFWRFHEPAAYGPLPSDELAASRSRVADAYRWVDEHLGLLLARLGPEVTVLVASDHGFQAQPETGRGTHRTEGIFLAAGPGVTPRSAPIELSVLDLVPTVLLGLGLPCAQDMDGVARSEVFRDRPSVPAVGTYETMSEADAAAAPPKEIDRTTEEQLRSLGYIE